MLKHTAWLMQQKYQPAFKVGSYRSHQPLRSVSHGEYSKRLLTVPNSALTVSPSQEFNNACLTVISQRITCQMILPRLLPESAVLKCSPPDAQSTEVNPKKRIKQQTCVQGLYIRSYKWRSMTRGINPTSHSAILNLKSTLGVLVKMVKVLHYKS